jgi:hypothetical protein
MFKFTSFFLISNLTLSGCETTADWSKVDLTPLQALGNTWAPPSVSEGECRTYTKLDTWGMPVQVTRCR